MLPGPSRSARLRRRPCFGVRSENQSPAHRPTGAGALPRMEWGPDEAGLLLTKGSEPGRRGMHGVGPGEARRTGAALSSQSRMAFRLTVEGSSSMRQMTTRCGQGGLHRRRAQGPFTAGACGAEPGDHGLRPRNRPAGTGAPGEAVGPGAARHRRRLRRPGPQPRRGHRTRLLPRRGHLRGRSRGHGRVGRPVRCLGGLHHLRAGAAGHPGVVAGRLHRVVSVERSAAVLMPGDPARSP